MANIRNSISMQDRMTPVFRSIIKSMDSTLRVMRQMDRQANNGVQGKAYQRAQRDIQKANNELIKMQNNLSRCDKEAKNLSSATKGIDFSRAGSGLSSFLTGLSSALYLAKNIGAALSKVMETPDTMSAIKYRLETYDTTNATGGQLMGSVYKAAQASRSDIQSTADLASRILISGATGGSGSDAIGLAEILNKASFLGGSSSQESQRALLQLSQGLASGALQGDELRAIREQAPGLTDTLARGLSSLAEKGMLPEKFLNTTMGDLKQLGADGELTAQRIVAAFKEMEDYVDSTFEKSPKQFGQAVTGILNVWKKWLGLMGEGDNALAKINQKAWQLLEWFESPAGEEFFSDLTIGINLVVDGILQVIDWIGDLISWFSELENSSRILQSAFMSLGMVAAGAGIVAAVAWAINHWEILAIIALLGVLSYSFLDTRDSAGEAIGDIGKGLVWTLAIIALIGMAVWDTAITIIAAAIWVLAIIIMLGANIIQAIGQVLIWIVLIIDTVFILIHNIIASILMAVWSKMEDRINAMADKWIAFGLVVADVLKGIASVIDKVFGTNLSAGVEGFIDKLNGIHSTIETKFDGDATRQKIDDMWVNSAKYTIDRFSGKGKEDYFLLDDMVDVWKGGLDITRSITDPVMLEGTFFGDGSGEAYKNVWDWAQNSGAGAEKFGKNFDNIIDDTMKNVEKTFNEHADKFSADGVFVDGGALDSVGSIGSDVEISDEDIQLLRDVAARDFLLALQTSAPQVNNNFGDIRETADVNKILEVIQDMVDEQMAVSLVIE